jgi:hypothetical protein
MLCRRVSPVLLALGVGAAAILVFEVVIALFGTFSDAAGSAQFSYLSLSWVLLGGNMFCMVLCVHAITQPEAHYSTDALVASALRFAEAQRSSTPGAATLSAGGGGSASDTGAAWTTSAVRPPRNTGGSASTSSSSARAGTVTWLHGEAQEAWRAAVALYAGSLLCLVALSGAVLVMAQSNRDDQGPYLGLTTTAAILLADGCTLLAWRGGLFSSTGVVSMVVLLCRALIIAPGAKFWLLGHSLVYLVLGVFLASRVVVRFYARAALDPGDGSESGRKTVCNGVFGPVCGCLSPEAQRSGAGEHSPGCLSAAGDVLSSPAMLLLLLTVVFAGLIATFAVFLEPAASFPSALVNVLGREQPQWTYGMGAILIVFSTLGLHFSYEAYKRNGGSLTAPGSLTAAVATIAGIGGLGALVFIGTTSYVLLACTSFLPAVLALLVGIYGQWQRDDYALVGPGGFGWCFCCCPRGALCGGPERLRARSGGADDKSAPPHGPLDDGLSPASAGGASVASTSASAFAAMLSSATSGTSRLLQDGAAGVFSGGRGRNNAMLAATLGVAGLVIGFAFVFSLGIKHSEYGWMAALEILALTFAFFAGRKWFGTLEFHWFIPVALLLSLGLHVAAFVPLVILAYSTPADFPGLLPLGLVFVFAMVPFAVLLGTALYKWRDDRWQGSTVVYACLGLSQLVIIGFGGAGAIIFGQPALVAGILVAYVVGSAAAALGVTAAAHQGWLPRWAEAASFLVMCVIILAGVVSAVVEGSSGHFTNALALAGASWCLIAVAMVGGGLLSVLRHGAFAADPFDEPVEGTGGSGSRLTATGSVLPVFRLSTGTSLLVPASSPVVLVICGLLMLTAFGLVTAVLLQPAYIGLIVSAVAKGLLLVFCLEVASKARERVARACAIIDTIDARRHRRRPRAAVGVPAAAAPGIEVGSPALLHAVAKAMRKWTLSGAGAANIALPFSGGAGGVDAEAGTGPADAVSIALDAAALTPLREQILPTERLRLAVRKLEATVEAIEAAAGLGQLVCGCIGRCWSRQGLVAPVTDEAKGSDDSTPASASKKHKHKHKHKHKDEAVAGASGAAKGGAVKGGAVKGGAVKAVEAADLGTCCGSDGSVATGWRDKLVNAVRESIEAASSLPAAVAAREAGISAATEASLKAETGARGPVPAVPMTAWAERSAGNDDDDDDAPDAKHGSRDATADFKASASGASGRDGRMSGRPGVVQVWASSVASVFGESKGAEEEGVEALRSQLGAAEAELLGEAAATSGLAQTGVLLAAGWKALSAADRALANASMFEQALQAGVRLSLVGEGMVAAAEERSQWRSFLSWCAEVAEAIRDLSKGASRGRASGRASPMAGLGGSVEVGLDEDSLTRAGWVDSAARGLSVEEGTALLELSGLYRRGQRDARGGATARAVTGSFDRLRAFWKSVLAPSEVESRESLVGRLREHQQRSSAAQDAEQATRRLEAEAADAKRREQMLEEHKRATAARRSEEERAARERQAEATAEAERRRSAEQSATERKLAGVALAKKAMAARKKAKKALKAAGSAKSAADKQAKQEEAKRAMAAQERAEAEAKRLQEEAAEAAAEAEARAAAKAAREAEEARAKAEAEEKLRAAAERKSKETLAGAGLFESRAAGIKAELRRRAAAVKGPKWEDTAFTGNRARYGDASKTGKYDKHQEWRVYTEAIDGAVLTKSEFGADDLVQGSLGDCWLIAAIAVVASRKDLIERVFPVRESSKGVWPVQLCFNREWTTMWVDERFPMWRPGLSSKGKPLEGSSYVMSPDKQEMWPCLLEKVRSMPSLLVAVAAVRLPSLLVAVAAYGVGAAFRCARRPTQRGMALTSRSMVARATTRWLI